MKRVNNKGFAITTIIYGLSIMGVLIITILMGIMATTRSNSNKFAKSVEQELIRFSKTDTSFGPTETDTPKAQEYIVPTGESGWYRIELWGAQGGSNGNGGLGAYTSGIIKLEEGDVLYFYVGSSPGEGKNGSGQSTDVRIVGGEYDNNDKASKKSYETRIMVAAGGGSKDYADGGTLYGYNKDMQHLGGKIRVAGSTGQSADFGLIPPAEQSKNKSNGTLIGLPGNYKKSDISMSTSSEPKPHNNKSTGGDGYIASDKAEVGGVSFISGYAGSKAYVKGKMTNNPKYTYHEFIYGDSGEGSYAAEGKDYYFYDGKMLPGVNAGDGRAKIERVVEETDLVKELPRKNQKLNLIKGVRDCVALDNKSATIKWTDFQVIAEGNNIASTGTTREYQNGNFKCREIIFPSQKNVDEIAVWHQDGVDYLDHTMEVTKNGSSWEYIKKTSPDTRLSETETVNGIHISAYQPDYTTELPDAGNYYIIPVTSDTKGLTAHDSSDRDNDPLKVTFLNGYKRQSWSIELINENLRKPGNGREYKIIELSRFKSLSIYLDENKVGNQVRASSEFNALARNDIEIWQIKPIGNGTYAIRTVMPEFDPSKPSGYLIPQTNPDIEDHYESVLIGPTNLITERFKLIAIDY